MYTSLQASDPYFFARVLFTIDNAPQIHWRSCSNTDDRLSVDDRILLMTDTQDSILRHNFCQQLPKSISDKVLASLETPKDRDGKHPGGGKPLGRLGQGNDFNKNKDIITDSDKNHAHWKLCEGKNLLKFSTKINVSDLKLKMASRSAWSSFYGGFVINPVPESINYHKKTKRNLTTSSVPVAKVP
jgi:hypothetical protein